MPAPYAYALPRPPPQALLHFALSLPPRLRLHDRLQLRHSPWGARTDAPTCCVQSRYIEYTSSWPHCLIQAPSVRAPRPRRALGRISRAMETDTPVSCICTGASPVRCAHQDAGHARAGRDAARPSHACPSSTAGAVDLQAASPAGSGRRAGARTRIQDRIVGACPPALHPARLCVRSPEARENDCGKRGCSLHAGIVQCRGAGARPPILRTSMAARDYVPPRPPSLVPSCDTDGARGVAARGPSEGGRDGLQESPRDFEKTKGAALRRG
ncbi:hypothetical protein FB451DRAFT_1281296 [Mycena latifolia]|nr:hypothetical protein FB451DRAFT_1281296 [Mycena latifolia]